MLLEVSPVSRIRPRLTVIVFAMGGGKRSGGSMLFAEMALEEEVLAAARPVSSGEGESAGPPEAVGSAGAEFAFTFGSGVGEASLELIAGGSASDTGSVSSREMMTVSAASLDMPPASARTSIKET